MYPGEQAERDLRTALAVLNVDSRAPGARTAALLSARAVLDLSDDPAARSLADAVIRRFS